LFKTEITQLMRQPVSTSLPPPPPRLYHPNPNNLPSTAPSPPLLMTMYRYIAPTAYIPYNGQ